LDQSFRHFKYRFLGIILLSCWQIKDISVEWARSAHSMGIYSIWQRNTHLHLDWHSCRH